MTKARGATLIARRARKQRDEAMGALRRARAARSYGAADVAARTATKAAGAAERSAERAAKETVKTRSRLDARQALAAAAEARDAEKIAKKARLRAEWKGRVEAAEELVLYARLNPSAKATVAQADITRRAGGGFRVETQADWCFPLEGGAEPADVATLMGGLLHRLAFDYKRVRGRVRFEVEARLDETFADYVRVYQKKNGLRSEVGFWRRVASTGRFVVRWYDFQSSHSAAALQAATRIRSLESRGIIIERLRLQAHFGARGSYYGAAPPKFKKKSIKKGVPPP